MKELTDAAEIANWFKGRTWSVNGDDGDEPRLATTSLAARVVFPMSTQEVADILAALHPDVPVAVVCGGHNAGNVATRAGAGALVLDLKGMDSVSVDATEEEVTVGGGAKMQQLVEAVAAAGRSLPVGTGATIGVAGYVLNGGLSGYFGRRLGLLGQRVTRLTLVDANGAIRNLSPDSDGELFRSVLGAGAALGVVTSLTFRTAPGDVVRTGGQFVVPCGEEATARAFALRALTFQRDSVMPDASVAMELVVTGDWTCICTLVFFDAFKSDPVEFAKPLRAAAAASGLAAAVDDVAKWTTWLEVASCLWPIIAGMAGSPVVRIDHCVGASGPPSDALLSFVADEWLVGIPFAAAPMSLLEARVLGGAAADGECLPTGNHKVSFFVDMIVCYDGAKVTDGDREAIRKNCDEIVRKARALGPEVANVDFSACHSQPRGARVADLVGGTTVSLALRDLKLSVDPFNRFRFHPIGDL